MLFRDAATDGVNGLLDTLSTWVQIRSEHMGFEREMQAGFFLRFVPADVLAGETEEIGQPCCFVLSCTQELCMATELQLIYILLLRTPGSIETATSDLS